MTKQAVKKWFVLRFDRIYRDWRISYESKQGQLIHFESSKEANYCLQELNKGN